METKSITGWDKVAWFIYLISLTINCSTRIGILFLGNPLTTQFLGLCGIALCLLPIFRPSWLKAVLFCFALTFPLYGSLPYSTHSFLFELYLSCLAITLSVRVYKDGLLPLKSGILQSILFLYAALSCASLLLLPVRNIGWQFVLWDWNVFWNAVFFATPELSLYSIAAIIRLGFYIVFVILLSRCREAKRLYHAIFIGLLIAAFWAAIIGIVEHFKLIDLLWFRGVDAGGLRLQSVFANPGWFAEFLAVTIPYVLLGFVTTELKPAKKLFLFGILVVCEIAIILTYSRTGWIIYPLVLTVCWLFFYLATQADAGRFTWGKVAKVFLQVIVSVPLTVCISYFLIFHVFDLFNFSVVKESAKFTQRISQITNPASRKVIFKESLGMIEEKPLYGLGYESFKLHNNILKKVKKEFDTPHNFYLQLLVNGGVVGLVLWGTLIFATLYLLVTDLIRNKTYSNIAVILSVVAFHLYGLAQSMQYIPMIWFLLFINIGYAMTIQENVLPDWLLKKKTGGIWILLLIVSTGVVVYAKDFESKKLAVNEKLKIYSLDQEQNNYLGFYPAEHWQGQGIFRWTGTDAVVKLPRAQLFQLTFVCGAPDLAVKPLVVSVYQGSNQIDEIMFFRQESIQREYFIPQAGIEDEKLFIHASRTWNLKKLGLANDSRNLGVAISEVKVVEKIPPDGFGFYHWENWQGSSLAGKTERQFYYRWTGREALFTPLQLEEDKTLYLRAGQPGLPDNPLLVQVWQAGSLVESVQLFDTQWHSITLRKLKDMSKPCHIKVARTWNAKKIGVGEDSRALGVAVAGLTKKDASQYTKRATSP